MTDEAQTFQELTYRGKVRSFETAGTCRVQLKEVCQIVEGECYWMAADELHRIVNVGDHLTVTLMMHPPNTRSWARNIILADTIPNAKPSYLSVTELRLLIEEILAALKPSVSF